MKKEIRIYYTDFMVENTRNFMENFLFTKMLKKKYKVIIDDKNPEYIFCSCFGKNILKYAGIRILVLGENIVPDFNIYDYAIGFHHIEFEDRYIRFPLCYWSEKEFQGAYNKHILENERNALNRKFCNFVVSNGNGADPLREKFFDMLCEYKKVDSGGKYRNNLEGNKPVDDKLEFQKQYKFSLAFENSSTPGYITEKIIQAWEAGTVPIYWGANDIGIEFNERALININSFTDLNAAIEEIKKIDNNDELYLELLKQPIQKENKREQYCSDVQNFLNNIVEQGEKAYRRQSFNTMWGKYQEEEQKILYIVLKSKIIKILVQIYRKVKGFV